MIAKPEFCSRCPINEFTGTAYVPLQRGASGTLLVGEAPGENEAEEGKPFVGGSGSFLNNLLSSAGIRRPALNIINTIGCRPPQNVYPSDHKWNHTSKVDARAAVEYCRQHHLQPAIDLVKPTRIVALGDRALESLTTRKGIMVWRGSALPLKGDNTCLKVIPTLHPAYLLRDMKLTSVVINDLKKPLTPSPENYNLFGHIGDLQEWVSKKFAFDFEWDWRGAITINGMTDRFYQCLVASWWGQNIHEFRRIFESATDLIGHNIIGADTKYFEKMGWDVSAKLHDTMLKQHLVQPDYRHGLGFVASVFTNKMFWKGKGREEEDADGNIIETKTQWKTWNQTDSIPRSLGGYGGCLSEDEAYRLYNARDTDASFQANTHLDYLLEKYNLVDVYWNVSVPIAFIARDLSDRGIRIDPEKVKNIRTELTTDIEKLDLTLPEGLRSFEKDVVHQVPAPPDTYKARTKKCKGSKKLNTKHNPTEITFYTPGEILECGVCGAELCAPKLAEIKKIKVPGKERVSPWNSSQKVMAYAKEAGLKIYINRKRGTAAADVNARKSWGRTHPEFRIIDKLKDLGTLRNNFAKSEMENVDRLFFNLLVHGTSEGRFSSSGKREGIDPNIQNQPKSIRKIYITDHPSWSFIELDYSQGENMLTAFLAKDWDRLERLRQPGYSEHLEVARMIFGLPAGLTKDEAKHLRKGDSEFDAYDIGKHVNHGSNYGMTHVKLKEYCESEGYFFSEAECKEFIQIGKRLNPRTAQWQLETIETAKRDGALRNPFGRMRWFSTRDISTKSLAFLPASTLADIIIRAMIGHYPSRFPNECRALGLQVHGDLVGEWLMSIQVHDALVLQGPDVDWQTQAHRTKAIMTQPWRELDGFGLGVEVTYSGAGKSWGECKGVEL